MSLDIHITGVGVFGSGGATAEENWQTLCSGKNNFVKREGGFLSALSSTSESKVNQVREEKYLSLVDRTAIMGILSARESVSQVDSKTLKSSLVVMGSSRGGIESYENSLRAFDKGQQTDKYRSLTTHAGTISSALSYALGSNSGSMTIGSACVSGLQAIGLGATLVKEGHANSALVGGAEAPLTSFNLAQAKSLGIQTTLGDTPYSCRPFHPHRAGTVFAEGAATLFLERQPSRPSLAIIKSYFTSTESGMKPSHSETAESLQFAILKALSRAQLAPNDIDLIVGHGSGTQVGDAAEQKCYLSIFGESQPPVVLNKWALGHLAGGSGALNAVMACFHLKENWITGHPYFEESSPLFRSYQCPLRNVLITGLGFGGAAGALVLQKPERVDVP